MIDWGYASLTEAHARQERYRNEVRNDALLALLRNVKPARKAVERQDPPKVTQLRRGHA